MTYTVSISGHDTPSDSFDVGVLMHSHAVVCDVTPRTAVLTTGVEVSHRIDIYNGWPAVLRAFHALRIRYGIKCAWVSDDVGAYAGCILEHPEFT